MTKATPRQARWTLLIAAIAVAVTTAFVLGARDRLLEEWYLSRLESENVAVLQVAAKRLGELESLRAFPWLTKAAREVKLPVPDPLLGFT